MKRTHLGIDLGSACLKAAWVRKARRSFVLHRWSLQPSPPEALVQGAPSPEALAPALRALVAGGSRRGAVSALPAQAAVTRTVHLPPAKPRELERVLAFEAAGFLPFPVEQATVAVAPTRTAGEYLVAAVPRAQLQALTQSLRKAGIRPRAIGVDAFALERVIRATHGRLASGLATAVIDFGARGTRVLIFEDEIPVVTRSLPAGGDDLTRALAVRLGVAEDEAEAAKRRWGADAATPISEVMQQRLGAILDDVIGSVRSYLMQDGARRIGRWMLVGGGANLRNLEQETLLGLQRQLPQRLLERVPSQPETWRPSNLLAADATEPPGPEIAAAVGLALWEVDAQCG